MDNVRLRPPNEQSDYIKDQKPCGNVVKASIIGIAKKKSEGECVRGRGGDGEREGGI